MSVIDFANHSAVASVAATPALLEPILEDIPADLRRINRWAPWEAVLRPSAKGGGGRYDKVPRNPRNLSRGLSSRAAWYDVATAWEAWLCLSLVAPGGGIGFNLTGLRGLVAGDLDDCLTQDGSLKPWAAEIVAKASTYAELSPSGRGVRFFLRAHIEQDWTQVKPERQAEGVTGIEIYGGNSPRFVTVTGRRLEGCPTVIGRAPEGFLTWLEETYRYSVQGTPTDLESDAEMPGLAEASELPRLDDLSLPMHVRAFLDRGEYGSDGSRAVSAAAIALLEATATADGLHPDVVLSLLADNPHVWEVARRHRRDDDARALEYLWKHHVVKGEAKAKPAILAFDALGDDVMQTKEGSKRRRKFQPVHIAGLDPKPMPYLIKGILPRGEVGVIFGVSTAGKSFAVLDMLFAIARGVDFWRGHRVRQARVVYVATEGQGGLWSRAEAYARYHRVDLTSLPVSVVMETPYLLQGEQKALAHEIIGAGGADLIVIDTLARAMSGGDENSALDMGRATAAAEELHRLTGAMVLLVHHAGKDVSRGARGSSSLKGALDVELSVSEASDGLRVLEVTKLKDGHSGAKYFFRLDQVALGVDEDGDEIASAVVVEAGPPSGGGVTFDHVYSDDEICAAQIAIAAGNYRESAMADDWAGKAIGPVLGLNHSRSDHRKMLKTLIADWVMQGHLRIEEHKNHSRKYKKFVRVGRTLEPTAKQ